MDISKALWPGLITPAISAASPLGLGAGEDCRGAAAIVVLIADHPLAVAVAIFHQHDVGMEIPFHRGIAVVLSAPDPSSPLKEPPRL